MEIGGKVMSKKGCFFLSVFLLSGSCFSNNIHKQSYVRDSILRLKNEQKVFDTVTQHLGLPEAEFDHRLFDFIYEQIMLRYCEAELNGVGNEFCNHLKSKLSGYLPGLNIDSLCAVSVDDVVDGVVSISSGAVGGIVANAAMGTKGAVATNGAAATKGAALKAYMITNAKVAVIGVTAIVVCACVWGACRWWRRSKKKKEQEKSERAREAAVAQEQARQVAAAKDLWQKQTDERVAQLAEQGAALKLEIQLSQERTEKARMEAEAAKAKKAEKEQAKRAEKEARKAKGLEGQQERRSNAEMRNAGLRRSGRKGSGSLMNTMARVGKACVVVGTAVVVSGVAFIRKPVKRFKAKRALKAAAKNGGDLASIVT